MICADYFLRRRRFEPFRRYAYDALFAAMPFRYFFDLIDAAMPLMPRRATLFDAAAILLMPPR